MSEIQRSCNLTNCDGKCGICSRCAHCHGEGYPSCQCLEDDPPTPPVVDEMPEGMAKAIAHYRELQREHGPECMTDNANWIVWLADTRDALLAGFNRDGESAREVCCRQYKQELLAQLKEAQLALQFLRIAHNLK